MLRMPLGKLNEARPTTSDHSAKSFIPFGWGMLSSSLPFWGGNPPAGPHLLVVLHDALH